jgi:nucleotide-binding universal stress UspA family protein
MLSTPDRIMVATDLTDLESLLPHAIIQARTYNAPVTFVHAISAMVAASVASTERVGEDPLRLIKDVRHALQDFVKRVELESIPCSTAVRIGSASEVIREQLLLPGSARIIMGTHGRGKLRQLALGSVAHALIAKGDVSILIVGPHARENSQHVTPRHILHPVSFLGEYKVGARLAFDLAKQFDAELTLLHVLDPGDQDCVNPGRMIAWATDVLQNLVPNAQEHTVPTHIKVVSGKVADQILRVARASNSDWIILNTDEGTATGVFNESRAFEVLAASECPVLTFRF